MSNINIYKGSMVSENKITKPVKHKKSFKSKVRYPYINAQSSSNDSDEQLPAINKYDYS